jgi:hypothetical protein
LLTVPHSLTVGRACQGLLARLPAIRQGLVSHLPPQGVVGQAFDLLVQAVPGERLKDLDNPRVQGAPPLLEEAAIGHLHGQEAITSCHAGGPLRRTALE